MRTSIILFCVFALVFFSFDSTSALFDGKTTRVDSFESCDLCICALSEPPQCQCTDIKGTCHGCDACACTKSIPPQCHCRDIKPNCAPSSFDMGSKRFAVDSFESCDLCICALSEPPQCQCTDIKGTCHGCDACACTKSIPPQCHCRDIKPNCAPSSFDMGSGNWM